MARLAHFIVRSHTVSVDIERRSHDSTTLMGMAHMLYRCAQARGTRKEYTVRHIQWVCPQVGVVKITCDGAMDAATGCAMASGLIRDHEGLWIVGFNRKLGVCSILMAELWAIYDELRIA